jgi:hypothetical protein
MKIFGREDVIVLLCYFFAACGQENGNTSDTDHEADSPPDAVDVSPDGNDIPADEIGEDTEWARIDISGARTAHWEFNGDDNVITCDLGSGTTLHVTAANQPFFTQAVLLTFEGYTGPGFFDFEYDSSSIYFRTVSVTDGDYGYHFLSDFSRIDFHWVNSHCTLDVTNDPTGPAGFLSGTLICENLVAENTSADYMEDPVEFQPTIGLTINFRCETSF